EIAFERLEGYLGGFFMRPFRTGHKLLQTGERRRHVSVQRGRSLGIRQLAGLEGGRLSLSFQRGEVQRARFLDAVRQQGLEYFDFLLECGVEIVNFLFLPANVLPLGLSLLLATESRGFADVAGAFALRLVDGGFPTTLCCGRLPFGGGSMTLRGPLR